MLIIQMQTLPIQHEHAAEQAGALHHTSLVCLICWVPVGGPAELSHLFLTLLVIEPPAV